MTKELRIGVAKTKPDTIPRSPIQFLANVNYDGFCEKILSVRAED